MHIILFILKIIGFILLGILGLILLLALILLLSPFGYSATGCYHSDGNKKLLGNFHYLFHALRLDVTWNGEKVKFRVKFFGFTLKKGSTGLGDSEEKPEKKETQPKAEEEFFHETVLEPEVKTEPEELVPEPVETKVEPPVVEVKPEPVAVKEEPAKVESEPIVPKPDPVEIASEAKQDTQEEKQEKPGPWDKINELIEKGQKAYEMISQPSMIKMRNRVLNRLFKLLKHVLPRDLNIKGEFGLKDPALMGKIMEVYAFLYAFWGEHFEISTDFEREHIDVKGRIRGHVVPAYLLHQVIWMGLAILWQKDVRKFIFAKLFHK